MIGVLAVGIYDLGGSKYEKGIHYRRLELIHDDGGLGRGNGLWLTILLLHRLTTDTSPEELYKYSLLSRCLRVSVRGSLGGVWLLYPPHEIH